MVANVRSTAATIAPAHPRIVEVRFHERKAPAERRYAPRGVIGRRAADRGDVRARRGESDASAWPSPVLAPVTTAVRPFELNDGVAGVT